MTVGRSQSPTHQTGEYAENLALEVMHKAGFELVVQNYHSRFGEIDLIMRQGKQLVFAEVKARKIQGFGSALEAVDIHKQRKLCNTARFFLAENPDLAALECRFDVLGITLEVGVDPQIDWIESAFECDG